MKKILKVVGGIVIFFIALVSIIKLVQLIKKYSLLQVLGGVGKLNADDTDLVEISKNGTKFLTRSNETGLEAFKDYLDASGYSYIGQFGSSNLYEFDGVEIVVKRSSLFGKYYLFEIFNERYFEETSEYLTV